ncbi:MAG: hypothetical protein QM820_56350 [Minicystis sp.]
MAETRFFFWNLDHRQLARHLADAAAEHNLDIILLAESSLSIADIGTYLPNFSIPTAFGSPRIQILTRGNPADIVPLFDDPAARLTIRRFVSDSRQEVLIAAVHYYDKSNWSDSDQLAEVANLATDIINAESRVGHSRTILVGDLNMNPFDHAVVAAKGLHGVMTRSLARKRTRTVAGREYPFFFNPMWGLLGERADDPPGTHFYSQAVHVNYFWHTIDQVLVRPDLMDGLMDVRVLDRIGGKTLLTREGRPAASDHLPLYFRIDL